jgi:hypothetical protein
MTLYNTLSVPLVLIEAYATCGRRYARSLSMSYSHYPVFATIMCKRLRKTSPSFQHHARSSCYGIARHVGGLVLYLLHLPVQSFRNNNHVLDPFGGGRWRGPWAYESTSTYYLDPQTSLLTGTRLYCGISYCEIPFAFLSDFCVRIACAGFFFVLRSWG